jgi:TetR/AcrR family transcriptional regulator
MMAKASRRDRERERHRREILMAALNLFSRKGFADTTMAEIAAQAEFAVGTLYRFFKDKQALYHALIADTVREFAQAASAAIETPGTEIEKLERYIETKARLFVQHIPAARLYFAQTALAMYSPALGLDRDVRAIYDGVVDRLESIIRNAVRKKLLVDVEPRMLLLGLEGVSNAFLPALMDRPDDFSAEEMATATKRIFFERVRLKATPA